MLRKDRLHFLFAGEPTFLRSPKPTIDSIKLLGRRLVGPAPERCIDFERDLGKLLLGLLGPSLGTLHRFFQCLRRHEVTISYPMIARHAHFQFLTSGMSSPCSLT